MNTIFCTGTELRELKRSQADCWILYVTSGEADFVAGSSIYHAGTGFVVIVSMTNTDIQIHTSTDYASYILQVNDTAAYDLVRRHLHLMNAADSHIIAIPTGRQQNHLLRVFQNLSAQNGNLEAARELLHELMVRVYRASLKIVAGIHSNRMDLVTDLQERLKKCYNEDITLESLAATYRISISYLSHVFKGAVGVPIMRYLLCCRVDAAKQYLTESDLSISEIAKQCGFHDISNFGRTFKKETGHTPREYRNKHHKV